MPSDATATLPVGVETAVRVRGLRKAYADGPPAVGGIDLDIARGEVFGLLGPNGAGKSTTTEILEGYRHRDGGEVTVLGTDPWRAPDAWRARVGIVAQESAEKPELTVIELIRHFATFYPRTRRPDEVVDLVGLTDKSRARVASLSGGQRRRLDVALGIVGRPELLFLDEPTTGFDPAARRQFWALISQLREEGTTIMLTTHYLDEAEYLADRVAVINHGVLVACAAPDDLGREMRSNAVVRWTGEDGRTCTEHTERPTAFVGALAHRLHTDEVPDLRVSRMSLEDVYLSLIGGPE